MMEKKYARLAALLTVAVLCGNGAPSMADDLVGNAKDGWSIVIDNGHDGNVYGNKDTPNTTTNAVTGHVKMTGGTVNGEIYGGYSNGGAVTGSTVTITGGTVNGDVYGGKSKTDTATGNTVTIGGIACWNVYGGYSNEGAATSNTVTISDGTVTRYVYGGYSNGGAVTGNTVTIGGIAGGNVFGGYSDMNAATGNTVTISDGTVTGYVYGGYSNGGASTISGNTVTITGGKVTMDVYGGRSNGGAATGNTVTITGGSVDGDVYGGYSNGGGKVSCNTVTISGGEVTGLVCGGYSWGDYGEVSDNTLVVGGGSSTVGGLRNFDSIEFRNVELSPEGKKSTELTVEGTVDNIADDAVKITSLAAGDYASGEMTATVSWDSKLDSYVNTDAIVGNHYFCGDREAGGLYVNQFDTTVDTTKDHEATITANVRQTIVAGQFIDKGGETYQNSAYEGDEPQTLVISDGFTTNAGTVAGVYDASVTGKGAAGGSVLINGSTDWTGTVYGGCSETGAAAGNTVYVGGYDETGVFHKAEAGGVTVIGGNQNGSENTLAVTGKGNKLGSIGGLDSITFSGAAWNQEAALSVTSADVNGTSFDVKSVEGGHTYQAGDKLTLLQSKNAMTGTPESIHVDDTVTAGVTQDLSVETISDANSVGLTVQSVALNPQTDLIAENRAVAAAFVNQGADIAADSLRLLDDGYHFGMQTFGAVYGNRSQYDAASDIKINGWSEIAGFGNIHEVKGGRLAWGVFYENGTGNYRTWNTFNNEMFRGDGSLLYNGGGAAVRLTKDSGMYYEASLRAGTLSSSMSNAVKDGNGNSYGFDSDSTYWGAHVGAGKLIQRGSGQWDIYGKYFHTDIDGDSFEMGGDRFSFDSVTSDRLRLGARYTADTDKAWSLYCGAAYEYEFSGDSHMKAGQFEAPEQSLQGSTVFGEIGTVWGRKDSPWSMDVNLRGYAGEQEGFSGMVQLAYAF